MKLFSLLAAAVLIASPLAAALDKKPAEPLRVAQGQRVDLKNYLLAGKTVVFDFTSKFCPPCRAYDEPLHLLHTKRDDIVVVKVDINRPDVRGIDWQSPVAQQYGLRSIPSFKVYSPEGKLIAEDKIEIGPDGRPAARGSAGRALVDSWINSLPKS